MAPNRIPLIYNHFDQHLASPDAAQALLLVSLRGESPMNALAVYRECHLRTTNWQNEPQLENHVFSFEDRAQLCFNARA